jgi:hypothetical protein
MKSTASRKTMQIIKSDPLNQKTAYRRNLSQNSYSRENFQKGVPKWHPL